MNWMMSIIFILGAESWVGLIENLGLETKEKIDGHRENVVRFIGKEQAL